MNAELLARYDGARVPRYTSYPTAPHFGPAVGPERLLDWLGRLSAGTAASIYLHVPFCESMCWYCGCHTKVVARYQPVSDYLEQLRREINLIADAVPGRLTIGHLHWGGGTPNMVAPDDFRAVMAVVRARFDFAPGAELATEIDPRTLTPAHVAAMADAGITRASLGVQDFDAGIQKSINRIQPFEQTREAVERLRTAGVNAINLDLMYGLPAQTEEHCRRTAELALSLQPDRLAVFGYAHVPWMKTHQRMIDEAALPDAIERWRQFAVISETLIAGGQQAIGLDHFARAEDEMAVVQRAGRLRRNFQGYTTDESEVLLGFGASAIGALPDGYVQNSPDYHKYETAIAAGRPATARGLELTTEDRLRRDLIERLMCDLAVDLEAVAARHGAAADHFDAELAALAGLVTDGLVEVSGRRLTVPESARPLVRLAAAAFDPYLVPSQESGAAKHSRAI
ncbi:MAG: oxygen-independent coproporphyrinogen III oxidase [Rhodospirillaceae bacterium]